MCCRLTYQSPCDVKNKNEQYERQRVKKITVPTDDSDMYSSG
jgi:hypothetical protein